MNQASVKSLVVPVFPAGGAAQRFGLHAGAELDDVLEHGGHGARDFRRDHVVHGGMRLLEQRAIVAGHAANHVRVDADAVVGKDGERRDVLEQIQIRRAQRDGQIRRQRTGDAEAPRHVDDRR